MTPPSASYLLRTAAERALPASLALRLRARRAVARGHNPELAMLPVLAAGGGGFVDVGANIGDWSRVAALHFPWVAAFEPIPELAAKLRRELPARSVAVHQIALSDAGGEALLRIPTDEAGVETTGLASLRAPEGPARAAREVRVPTATMDSFDLRGVAAVKIDVEGFEGAVVAGAAETLRRERPALVVEIEERHHAGGGALDVFRALWALGYRAFAPAGPAGGLRLMTQDSPEWQAVERHPALLNRSPDRAYVNNFVFVHPDRPFRGLPVQG